MFHFHFVFSDGLAYDVDNVHEITITIQKTHKSLSGDAILSERLPLDDMFLYTDSGCVSIAGKNLLVIDVSKRVD